MPKGEEGIRMIKYEKLETIRNNKKGRNVFFFNFPGNPCFL